MGLDRMTQTFEFDVVAQASTAEQMQAIVRTAKALSLVAADLEQRVDTLNVHVQAIASANAALLTETASLQSANAALVAEIERLRKLGASGAPTPVPPRPIPPPPASPPPPLAPAMPPPVARTDRQMRDVIVQEMAKESTGTFTESQMRGWVTHFSIDAYNAMTDQQFRAAVRAQVLKDMQEFPGAWPPRIKTQDVVQPVLSGAVRFPTTASN